MSTSMAPLSVELVASGGEGGGDLGVRQNGRYGHLGAVSAALPAEYQGMHLTDLTHFETDDGERWDGWVLREPKSA